MSNLKLVDPIIQFERSRTSKNFVNLLDFFLKKEKSFSEQDISKLVKHQDLLVEFNHSSFFDFDKEFWAYLCKLNFVIDFSSVIGLNEDSSNDSVIPLKNHDEPALASSEKIEFYESISNFIGNEERLSDRCQREKTLRFFQEINDYINDYIDINHKQKVKLKSYCSEISELLTGFICYKDNENYNDYECHAYQNSMWVWIVPLTIKLYQSALDFLHSDNSPSNRPIKRAAIETQIFTNLIQILYISAPSLDLSKKIRKKIVGLVKKFKYFNYNSAQVQKFCSIINNEMAEKWIFMSSLGELLYLSTDILFIRNDVLPYIFNAFICGFTDMDVDIYEIEDEKHSTFSLFLMALLPIEERCYNSPDFYDQSITLAMVAKDIKSHFDPSYDLSIIVYLVSLSGFRITEFMDELIIDNLSDFLVKEANVRFQKNQTPVYFGMEQYTYVCWNGSDKYCVIQDGHPTFYGCISTLAINMLDSEYHILFHYPEFDPTKSFIQAATVILEAGYTDYALVFLGYGLARISLGFIDDENKGFSVSLVNRFITQPIVWSRVRHCFVDLLNICELINPAMPPATKLWIKSIREQFQSADLYLLPKIEKPSEDQLPDEDQLPEWFSNSSDLEEISNALKSIKKAKQDTDRFNDDNAWEKLYKRYEVKNNLNKICQEIEKIAKEKFSNIRLSLKNVESPQLKDAMLKIDIAYPRIKYDQNSLGFICKLISSILKAQSDNYPNLENFINHLEFFDSESSNLLKNIAHSQPQLSEQLNHYREIRNRISHGSEKTHSIVNKTDIHFIYSYVTDDFKIFFDL